MDQDNLKQIASDVLEVVAEKASKAAELSKAGYDAATPVVAKAAKDVREAAVPAVTKAAEKAAELSKAGYKAAAPHVAKAVEVTDREARHLAAKASEKSKEAVAALSAISADAMAEVEKHAKKTPVPQKKHRAGKVVGWGTAAAGVGAVAYLLWRRSRPIEDPWAEEYWVDLQTDVDLDDVPAEGVVWVPDEVADKAGDVADAVADKAADAEEAVADKVEDVKDQAIDAADDAANVVKDAVEDAKD